MLPDAPIEFVAEKDGRNGPSCRSSGTRRRQWRRRPPLSPCSLARPRRWPRWRTWCGSRSPPASTTRVPSCRPIPLPTRRRSTSGELGRRLFYDPTWLTDEGGRVVRLLPPSPRRLRRRRPRPRRLQHADARQLRLQPPPVLGRPRRRRSKKSSSARSRTRRRRQDKLPFHVWSGVVRRLRPAPNTGSSSPTSSATSRRRTPSARRWRPTCARCWPPTPSTTARSRCKRRRRPTS